MITSAILQGLALVAWAILEWWLPRSRFRANSTIEAAANVLKPLLRRVPLVGAVAEKAATPVAPAITELPPPTPGDAQ